MADDRAAATESLTLAAERLVPRTRPREAGQVVVRRRVVTEEVTVVVPVRREELEILRLSPDEALPPGARRLAPGDTADPFGDDGIVLVLHEEVPDVQVETRVVERVHLRKVATTDEHEVRGEVRHEELDLETVGDLEVGTPATGAADAPA